MKQYSFPYPLSIKTQQLGRSKQDNQEIIDYFLNNQQLGFSLGTGLGWRTDMDIHESQMNIIGQCIGSILDFYTAYVTEPRNGARVPEPVKQKNDLFVDLNTWFQAYDVGDRCQPHEHGIVSRSSWVYYLDAGDGTPLVFENPETKQFLSIPVEDDMLIMFPSFVVHKVDKITQKRFVLAGNINDTMYRTPDDG